MKRLRDRLALGSVGRSAVDQMASLLKNAAEDTRSPTYGEFWGRIWETFTSSDETPLLASKWEHHSLLQHLIFIRI